MPESAVSEPIQAAQETYANRLPGAVKEKPSQGI